MITFAAPAFLVAGVAAALVPVALHLIRRRPAHRAPLPTARFLADDPRAAVRLGRPTDVLLMALRVLLLLLAGAAFARPEWRPARRGTADVVLLDRTLPSAPGDAWARAVAAARARLIAADGSARGALVLFGDSAEIVPARRIVPALFDSLSRARSLAPGPVRYAPALRAIPAAASALAGADSARVTLITSPRWRGWSDGLAPLRRAAWPGTVDLVELPGTVDTAPVRSGGGARRAVMVADRSAAPFASAALAAVGWAPHEIPAGAPLPDTADLLVAEAPVPASLAAELRARAGAGATVLVTGPAAESLRSLIPWTGPTRADSATGTVTLDDGVSVPGVAGRPGGEPARGATLIGAWEDGRPAAVARKVGRGCVVFAAADLERGAATGEAAYPRALERLARGCDAPETGSAPSAPLDAGARAVLRGNGPRVIAVREVAGAGRGAPLGRWLMAGALAAALAETFLAYGRRRAG